MAHTKGLQHALKQLQLKHIQLLTMETKGTE